MSFAHGKIQPPVPRRAALLSRPALESRLLDALQAHRTVLVCAPAGYGKTALLVRALTGLPSGHGLAWVSLDPGDDLHRLLECLLAALDPFDPPWRTAPEGLLAAVLRGDARGRQEVVDELVNTLAACELAHGVIVIDDLHHLEDEAGRLFLARLIDRLSARWTLALATREEPASLLARVAAAGELAAFRQADLQFTPAEVQAWLGPLGWDEAGALALHARTAGWAAGLRLAASGARGGSPGSAIDRAAFDYLATEVLARLEPGLRAFLLDTSVLHELEATRCSELTGDVRAARWLDEVERLGLFASVVDEASGSLRLHDLFRDALQHRLRIERPEDWLACLQRAAAVETDPVRRQSLLLAAQRPDDAARALLEAAPALNTGGAAATVLRLVDAFPTAFAAGSAELQRVAGLATVTVWRLQEAEQHFARAEALYAARASPEGVAAAQLMRARRAAVLVPLGRVTEAAALLDALAAGPPLIDDDARLVTAMATMWLRLERGQFDAVAPAFEALLQVLHAQTPLDQWAIVPPPRQSVCRGMAEPLQRWATGALAVAGERPVPLRALALLSLGWRALWQARLDEAAELLERAVADARWTGHEVIARSHVLALRAMLALLRGETAAALQAMRTRVDEQPVGYGGWGQWHVLFFAARVAGAGGDAGALRDCMQRLAALQPMLPDTLPQRLHPLAGLHGTLAWLEGRHDEALQHWHEVLDHEPSADLLGQVGEVRVRLALARRRAGARAEAAALLRPLLEAGDEGPRGAVFAAAALATLAREDWGGALDAAAWATLRRWAAALSGAVAATPAPTAAGAITDTGEKLTARELEVVALIARGQSNKLIARVLDMSPHTAKRHVANALAKLGLATRGQAAVWYHARRPSAQA